MARTPSNHPTDGELEILQVLWRDGPCTLGQICTVLRKQREVATTTVATMLKVMLEKSLVRRKSEGRIYEWQAAITQKKTARGMVGKLLDNVFDGSAHRLVAHLVQQGALSNEELRELETLIRQEQKKK